MTRLGMRFGSVFDRLAYGRATEDPAAQVRVRSFAVLLARALLSSIFLISGIEKLARWAETVDFMQANGFMAATGLFVALAVIVEVSCGLSILTGTLARIGAAVLVLYLVPVTFIFHDFWTFTGMEHQLQMIQFLKNLAIIGGLTMLFACGAGRFSVDRRLDRTPDVDEPESPPPRR